VVQILRLSGGASARRGSGRAKRRFERVSVQRANKIFISRIDCQCPNEIRTF
jgi:hypothetical protein